MKYRFSYRLFIKTEEGRPAVQYTVKLDEGKPCTIKEAEAAMKDAVKRIIDDIKYQSEVAPKGGL